MLGPQQSLGNPFEYFAITVAAMFLFVTVMVVLLIQKREATKAVDQSALALYKRNPADQGLRQAALEAGRQYTRFTRNSYGNA